MDMINGVSDDCYKEDLREEEFKKLTRSLFFEYISTNDKCYFLKSYFLLAGGYRIKYVLYDQGLKSDSNDRILIDSFDKDYRITIYNIFYLLKHINYISVSKENCEEWIKKQSFYKQDSIDQ